MSRESTQPQVGAKPVSNSRRPSLSKPATPDPFWAQVFRQPAKTSLGVEALLTDLWQNFELSLSGLSINSKFTGSLSQDLLAAAARGPFAGPGKKPLDEWDAPDFAMWTRAVQSNPSPTSRGAPPTPNCCLKHFVQGIAVVSHAAQKVNLLPPGLHGSTLEDHQILSLLLLWRSADGDAEDRGRVLQLPSEFGDTRLEVLGIIFALLRYLYCGEKTDIYIPDVMFPQTHSVMAFVDRFAPLFALLFGGKKVLSGFSKNAILSPTKTPKQTGDGQTSQKENSPANRQIAYGSHAIIVSTKPLFAEDLLKPLVSDIPSPRSSRPPESCNALVLGGEDLLPQLGADFFPTGATSLAPLPGWYTQRGSSPTTSSSGAALFGNALFVFAFSLFARFEVVMKGRVFAYTDKMFLGPRAQQLANTAGSADLKEYLVHLLSNESVGRIMGKTEQAVGREPAHEAIDGWFANLRAGRVRSHLTSKPQFVLLVRGTATSASTTMPSVPESVSDDAVFVPILDASGLLDFVTSITGKLFDDVLDDLTEDNGMQMDAATTNSLRLRKANIIAALLHVVSTQDKNSVVSTQDTMISGGQKLSSVPDFLYMFDRISRSLPLSLADARRNTSLLIASGEIFRVYGGCFRGVSVGAPFSNNERALLEDLYNVEVVNLPSGPSEEKRGGHIMPEHVLLADLDPPSSALAQRLSASWAEGTFWSKVSHIKQLARHWSFQP